MLVQTKQARDGPLMAVLVALVATYAALFVVVGTTIKSVATNNDTAIVANQTAQTAITDVALTKEVCNNDAIAVNIAAANNMEANKTMAIITTTLTTAAAERTLITAANLTSDNTEMALNTQPATARHEFILPMTTTVAANLNTATDYQALTTIEGTGGFGTCLATAAANLNTEAAKAPTTKGGECFGAELATTIAGLGVASFG